jgi:hypothetical protein
MAFRHGMIWYVTNAAKKAGKNVQKRDYRAAQNAQATFFNGLK